MLKNMKIGKKLLVTFIFVTVLSSIGGFVGFTVMRTMNSEYSSALVDYGFSQGSIGLFNTELNNNRAILRDIIIQTDDAGMQKSKQQLDASNAQLDGYLNNMKSGMVTDQEKQYYNTISTSMSQFETARDQVVKLALANQNTEAYRSMTQNCVPLATKIRDATNALIQEKTSTGNQLSSSLSNTGNIAEIAIFILIVLAMILSVITAVKISLGISKPVEELAEAAKKMAKGDLSAEVKINSNDEIGQLSSAFSETISTIHAYINDISTHLAQLEKGDLTIKTNLEYKGEFIHLKNSISGIVISLNEVISQIRQSSDQVSTGSDQVSVGSQALAQGATEQASSIEELAATITEISGQVKDNASHVRQASDDVHQVSEEIEQCNQSMQQMVQAMGKISNSSNQIEKIIKTIEDIAFQTNILSLNAAVEAARAGEAGKGFAVVADEVRNLAGKSAEAAKDTTQLIQNSIEQVGYGAKIADNTAESLLRAVQGVRSVTNTIAEISEATAKQSGAIQQVNLGVEQISSVVQTNSATAEESAAASEELSGQARMMKSLVQKFKVRAEFSNSVQSEA